MTGAKAHIRVTNMWTGPQLSEVKFNHPKLRKMSDITISRIDKG